MTKRKSKGPTARPIVALLLLGAVGLGGFAAYVRYGSPTRVPDELRAEKATPTAPATKESPAPDRNKVRVMVPESDGTDVKFQTTQRDVPAGEEPILVAVNGFLRECPFVDKSARAIGVDVKDGLATIDFNEPFYQTYGTTDENALLKGLRLSVGQFPNVKKVWFRIEGKPIDSLGSVELTDPISVLHPGEPDPDAEPTSSGAQP